MNLKFAVCTHRSTDLVSIAARYKQRHARLKLAYRLQQPNSPLVLIYHIIMTDVLSPFIRPETSTMPVRHHIPVAVESETNSMQAIHGPVNAATRCGESICSLRGRQDHNDPQAVDTLSFRHLPGRKS